VVGRDELFAAPDDDDEAPKASSGPDLDTEAPVAGAAADAVPDA